MLAALHESCFRCTFHLPPPTPPPAALSPPAALPQSMGKLAGTVALGVAAAGLASALAVDITDVALLAGVTAAGAAALSTPGAASRKSRSSLDNADEAAVAAEGEAVPTVTIASKASAPGRLLAGFGGVPRWH